MEAINKEPRLESLQLPSGYETDLSPRTKNPSTFAAAGFSLREFFARRHGRVGDSLPNDGSRVPKVHGGVNGYLSVM